MVPSQDFICDTGSLFFFLSGLMVVDLDDVSESLGFVGDVTGYHGDHQLLD